jgi:sugar phosphate isomerase/epimerase
MSIEEVDLDASMPEAAPHSQVSDTDRLEPGTGHLDWDRRLDALEEIGYAGWLAMEPRLSGPAEQVLAGVSKLLRRGTRFRSWKVVWRGRG